MGEADHYLFLKQFHLRQVSLRWRYSDAVLLRCCFAIKNMSMPLQGRYRQHRTASDSQYLQPSYSRFFLIMFSDDNLSERSQSPDTSAITSPSVSSPETPSTPLSPASPGAYSKMHSRDSRQDSATVLCDNSQPAVRTICCIGAGYVGMCQSVSFACSL